MFYMIMNTKNHSHGEFVNVNGDYWIQNLHIGVYAACYLTVVRHKDVFVNDDS